MGFGRLAGLFSSLLAGRARHGRPRMIERGSAVLGVAGAGAQHDVVPTGHRGAPGPSLRSVLAVGRLGVISGAETECRSSTMGLIGLGRSARIGAVGRRRPEEGREADGPLAGVAAAPGPFPARSGDRVAVLDRRVLVMGRFGRLSVRGCARAMVIVRVRVTVQVGVRLLVWVVPIWFMVRFFMVRFVAGAVLVGVDLVRRTVRSGILTGVVCRICWLLGHREVGGLLGREGFRDEFAGGTGRGGRRVVRPAWAVVEGKGDWFQPTAP